MLTNQVGQKTQKYVINECPLLHCHCFPNFLLLHPPPIKYGCIIYGRPLKIDQDKMQFDEFSEFSLIMTVTYNSSRFESSHRRSFSLFKMMPKVGKNITKKWLFVCLFKSRVTMLRKPKILRWIQICIGYLVTIPIITFRSTSHF